MPFGISKLMFDSVAYFYSVAFVLLQKQEFWYYIFSVSLHSCEKQFNWLRLIAYEKSDGTFFIIIFYHRTTTNILFFYCYEKCWENFERIQGYLTHGNVFFSVFRGGFVLIGVEFLSYLSFICSFVSKLKFYATFEMKKMSSRFRNFKLFQVLNL